MILVVPHSLTVHPTQLGSHHGSFAPLHPALGPLPSPTSSDMSPSIDPIPSCSVSSHASLPQRQLQHLNALWIHDLGPQVQPSPGLIPSQLFLFHSFHHPSLPLAARPRSLLPLTYSLPFSPGSPAVRIECSASPSPWLTQRSHRVEQGCTGREDTTGPVGRWAICALG